MNTRREELESNLRSVEEEIAPFSPTLIVVTKTYPIRDVEILRALGATNFGENRSDEGLEKSAQVSARWHYQGALQSKKFNEIISWADCIHSLDQMDHARKLEKRLIDSESRIDAFLQLSLDGDPERGGVLENELFAMGEALIESPGISLQGVMCVPPPEMDVEQAFSVISKVHQRFKESYPTAPFLSAGMSGDYMVALNHGATHLRVGSKILGQRQYR